MSRSTAARISKRLRSRLHPHPLSTTITGGVAWLRLERPQAGNRITVELAQALCDAAAEIELDDSVVAVVLAAAGSDFCLGVEESGDWETRVDWVKAIGNLTRPVIAAIQGDAFAEGFELALACDLRVVSDRARFAMSQLSMGHLPTHGGTQRLPRIVGRMRALDLLLTGRTIDAAEAAAMGLAARVVAPKDFDRTLDALVSELRTKGPDRTALRQGSGAERQRPLTRAGDPPRGGPLRVATDNARSRRGRTRVLGKAEAGIPRQMRQAEHGATGREATHGESTREDVSLRKVRIASHRHQGRHRCAEMLRPGHGAEEVAAQNGSHFPIHHGRFTIPR